MYEFTWRTIIRLAASVGKEAEASCGKQVEVYWGVLKIMVREMGRYVYLIEEGKQIAADAVL
jgi:hypothetical protein